MVEKNVIVRNVFWIYLLRFAYLLCFSALLLCLVSLLCFFALLCFSALFLCFASLLCFFAAFLCFVSLLCLFASLEVFYLLRDCSGPPALRMNVPLGTIRVWPIYPVWGTLSSIFLATKYQISIKYFYVVDISWRFLVNVGLRELSRTLDRIKNMYFEQGSAQNDHTNIGKAPWI